MAQVDCSSIQDFWLRMGARELRVNRAFGSTHSIIQDLLDVFRDLGIQELCAILSAEDCGLRDIVTSGCS